MATTTETQLPSGYFVAPDADNDVYLWAGREDSDDCQPLIARRALDREHPALWPALLLGLTLSQGTEVTTTIQSVYFDEAPFTHRNSIGAAASLEPTDEVAEAYLSLPEPLLTRLEALLKQQDAAHCASCGTGVGFVLRETPAGGERLQWTPTGVAREVGRDHVAVLCEVCTPYVPSAESGL